jgi:tRNA(His) guanylyltransferase
MNDTLGDRIKKNYEDRTRYLLPRRTYTILRLDGKAFHTYTRGLQKPFDRNLFEDIDISIIAMLPEIQGAVLAYTQSDEISVLVTDFAKPTTSAWFDGNLQKMVSVAASIMTAEFNSQRLLRRFNAHVKDADPMRFDNSAHFDCRAFTIPDRIEVMNYLRWRQQDCIRNSVSMVAQSNFSHKELHGKSQSDMHEMLHAKGVNWATDFTNGEKNGRLIVKETHETEVTAFDSDGDERSSSTMRTRWVSKGAQVFTQDNGALLSMIPQYE